MSVVVEEGFVCFLLVFTQQMSSMRRKPQLRITWRKTGASQLEARWKSIKKPPQTAHLPRDRD